MKKYMKMKDEKFDKLFSTTSKLSLGSSTAKIVKSSSISTQVLKIFKKREKPKYNLDDFDPAELFPEKNKKYSDYINLMKRLKKGPASLHQLANYVNFKKYFKTFLKGNTYISKDKFNKNSIYAEITTKRIYALRRLLKPNTGFRIILIDGKYILKNIFVNNS